ncbi:UDP-glycosyltransferase 87A1 isoform X1 [Rosa chinensis]|uniref:UDP-glycosyltransferase 87A1 isoform X1 n=1 Tax=Rosa chinensis TaxID=74649 RepID=UPI001AD8D7A0|nr:UDP-glycosyltransferase 87A1 isoform X1 [Rosa chinensis]
MDSATIRQPNGVCHIVAMPHPGRGHINPMMNLCNLLVSQKSDILITFVLTEEWLGLIGSQAKPDNIRFATIPNVVPSEKERAADMVAFFEAVMTKMEVPFEQLLEVLEPPPSAIVADTFLPWAVAVGNRRNISSASFWPMTGSHFSVFQHFHLFQQNGHFPIDLLGYQSTIHFYQCLVVQVVRSLFPLSKVSSSNLVNGAASIERAFPLNRVRPGSRWISPCLRHNYCLTEKGNERVDYIPGVSSIRLADTTNFIDGSQSKILDNILKAFSWVPKAQYLFVTSIYELETQVIDAIRSELSQPVYTIGPLLPSFKAISPTGTNHLQWLDSQPCSSVLYISMGSFLSVSSAQMDEIAVGLRKSGVRFFWVARTETNRLQEVCGDMGLVVPWCDQFRVLCHSSVGGYWSHCGWNSVRECVFGGVPFLTFPITFDQGTNSKVVVEDWKIGWRVKSTEVKIDHLVTSEEIAVLVKKFMDLEDDEGKELRRRTSQLQQIWKGAIAEGGSTKTDINAFIRDISQSLEG